MHGETATVDKSFLELARQVLKSDKDGIYMKYNSFKDDMKALLLAYRRFANPADLFSIWSS